MVTASLESLRYDGTCILWITVACWLKIKVGRSASRSLDHDLDFAGSTGRTGSGVAEALSEPSENKQVLDPFIANFRVADKKFPECYVRFRVESLTCQREFLATKRTRVACRLSRLTGSCS